jgi:hypothetical protein
VGKELQNRTWTKKIPITVVNSSQIMHIVSNEAKRDIRVTQSAPFCDVPGSWNISGENMAEILQSASDAMQGSWWHMAWRNEKGTISILQGRYFSDSRVEVSILSPVQIERESVCTLSPACRILNTNEWLRTASPIRR